MIGLKLISIYSLQAVPGSKLIIVSDASHMVIMEQPEAVNQVIDDFIKEAHS